MSISSLSVRVAVTPNYRVLYSAPSEVFVDGCGWQSNQMSAPSALLGLQLSQCVVTFPSPQGKSHFGVALAMLGLFTERGTPGTTLEVLPQGGVGWVGWGESTGECLSRDVVS